MYYLFVQCEGVDLRENPADAAVSSTDQDPERVKLLKQTKTEGATDRSERDRQAECLQHEVDFLPCCLTPGVVLHSSGQTPEPGSAAV